MAGTYGVPGNQGLVMYGSTRSTNISTATNGRIDHFQIECFTRLKIASVALALVVPS